MSQTFSELITQIALDIRSTIQDVVLFRKKTQPGKIYMDVTKVTNAQGLTDTYFAGKGKEQVFLVSVSIKMSPNKEFPRIIIDLNEPVARPNKKGLSEQLP